MCPRSTTGLESRPLWLLGLSSRHPGNNWGNERRLQDRWGFLNLDQEIRESLSFRGDAGETISLSLALAFWGILTTPFHDCCCASLYIPREGVPTTLWDSSVFTFVRICSESQTEENVIWFSEPCFQPLLYSWKCKSKSWSLLNKQPMIRPHVHRTTETNLDQWVLVVRLMRWIQTEVHTVCNPHVRTQLQWCLGTVLQQSILFSIFEWRPQLQPLV